jgi:hypothetical protein
MATLRPALRAHAAVVAAFAIGASIPLSGFNPFNNAGDVLHVDDRPELVFVMPATLIALAAFAAAIVWPRAPLRRAPRPLALGAALLLIGASLSVLGSDDASDTFVQVITAVVAPLALFVTLRRAALPHRPLAIAFAVTAAILLLRADVVFFIRDGLPTGDHLLRAKQSSEPRDFHYYGLQNPIPTAIFAVTVLAFVVLWVVREPGRAVRGVLGVVSAVSLLSVYLLYERIALVIALALAIYLLTAFRVGTPWRLGALGCLVAALAFIAATGPGFTSQASLLKTSGETRFDTIGRGLRVVVHHPVAGLGLGWSARTASHQPAHSAVLQAGVEMGVLAIAGVGLLTAWCIVAAWRAIRVPELEPMARGALVAVGVYALYTLIAGGVNAGLNSGLVSVWALTIALLMVIGVEAVRPGMDVARRGPSSQSWERR